MAGCGKLALAGAGDWEEVLQILEDRDIRGYQDVEKLCTHVGCPRTLEDRQLVAAEVSIAEEKIDTVVDDDDNSANIDLMPEK